MQTRTNATHTLRALLAAACLPIAISAAAFTMPALASDHADTPLLAQIKRHDARLTDLYAFTRGQNLVLVMGIDPAVPPGVMEYTFPTDVAYRFHIDTDSEVEFDDAQALRTYGGSIEEPDEIEEDLVFEIRFDNANQPQLSVHGPRSKYRRAIMEQTLVFAGLRDDPFIVKPRTGRNVAAIVLEVPLHLVVRGRHHHRHDDSNGVLLLWATSDIDGISGKQVELVGRAFRSTFTDTDLMNTLHPRLHMSELDLVPDVMIYDTRRPAAYPNGRELTDDVATIIADPRIVAIDTPSPDANDVPFMDQFPYLAAPQ